MQKHTCTRKDRAQVLTARRRLREGNSDGTVAEFKPEPRGKRRRVAEYCCDVVHAHRQEKQRHLAEHHFRSRPRERVVLIAEQADDGQGRDKHCNDGVAQRCARQKCIDALRRAHLNRIIFANWRRKEDAASSSVSLRPSRQRTN